MKFFIFIILLTLFSCSEVEKQAQFVQVESHQEDRGLIFQGIVKDCRSRWRYKDGLFTIEYYHCPNQEDLGGVLLDVLFDSVIKSTGFKLRNFKVELNVRNFIDIEKTVALYAAKSSSWDTDKGRPKGEKSEEFIKDYVNSENTYKTLSSTFAKKCYRIRVESVTDFDSFRASSLPYYPWLRSKKVGRRFMLPANYNLNFTAEPKHQHCF